MSNESANQKPDAPEAAEAEANPFEAELAKSRDDLLRALAEVENTRRRAERQAQEARVYAIDRFAGDLLPVADTLSRALAAVSPEARETDEAVRQLVAGVELTERALLDAFSRHGLKRVGAKGEPFNPNLHQAVAQHPSDQPPGSVAEVMQPGFVLGDRTLRAAIVSVSTGPTPASDGAKIDIKV